jgi:hypothetical protein
MRASWLIVMAALAIAGAAEAQSYVIQQPGASPVYVNPGQSGGYPIQSPGQSPVYVNPGSTSGFAVQSPGAAPTYVNPGDTAGAAPPPSRVPTRHSPD